MAPKQKLSQAQVLRLKHDSLLEQLEAWDVVIPDGATDLDLRAMLGRVMSGLPPLLGASTSTAAPVAAPVPTEGPEGPRVGF